MKIEAYYYNHDNKKVRLSKKVVNINPAKSSVLIRVIYCAICNSDIKEMRGERITRRDFGHECLGIVIESNAPYFKTGDFVVLDPHIEVERDTAFGEFYTVSAPIEKLKKSLFIVPENHIKYVLLEPLACAIHACNRLLTLGNQPKTILVYGAGNFGFLMYEYLKTKELKVYLGNRSADRLEKLEQVTGRLFKHDPKVPHAFDAVILAQSFISSADIEALLPQMNNPCAVLLFGAVSKEERLDLYAIRNNELNQKVLLNSKEVQLIGNLGAKHDDFLYAFDLLQQHVFSKRVEKIIVDVVDINAGITLINNMASGSRYFGKAVIKF